MVLQRELLLEKLSQKYQTLNHLQVILENENNITGITKNDMRLMSDFTSFFDELMTEVIEMEKSLIEEHPEISQPKSSFIESLEEKKISIKKAISEDPLKFQISFRSSNVRFDEVKKATKDTKKLCDFTPWIKYISSYKARVKTVKSDIEALRSMLTGKDSFAEINADRTAKQLEYASTRKYLVKPYYRRF